MNIHLARTGLPDDRSCVPAFEALASSDARGTHHLVGSPDDADVILFTECHLVGDWRLRPMLEHPLHRRFPTRCFVYDERDDPWCALPGVYVSAPRAGCR
ncbi:MAG: hypothetical protein JWL73_2222, partial [Actinomycetia bacterium]|nr:hypothetical protein [Actinomycetes bacterium]